MVSGSHRIKGETTDEAFKVLQEQCFLWERGASVGADFDLFNLTKPSTCTINYIKYRGGK